MADQIDELRIVFIDAQGNEIDSRTIRIPTDQAWVEPDHESWDVGRAVEELCRGDLRYAEIALDRLHGWHLAFEALRELPLVGTDLRKKFESFWVSYGLSLRRKLNDDALLFDVMRHLLNPYKGEGLVLFRGEVEENHARRTYGASWTTSIAKAREFAYWHRIVDEKAAVLVQTFAPVDAIISRREPENDYMTEQEYFVDARRLNEIRVIE